MTAAMAARPSIVRPDCDKEAGMKKLDILERLREHEGGLRQRGVSHAAVFGSSARGDQRPDSDIDIMVEIAADAPIGVFEYVGIVNYIEDLFPIPVDVVDRAGLKPFVRPNVERDAVYAF